jgi:hypothetical protein
MERQKKLRCKEEEIIENFENERRASCQVLARSRKYYWHMLERQIKASFDSAVSSYSNGAQEDWLTYPMLEEFLRHFGCLRKPNSSAVVAMERAAEESRKLRVALWRHLDPQKRGYVDFLTLTVFFHVLMGAVDEEARCLNHLSSSGQDLHSAASDEDLSQLSGGTPSKGLGQALSFGSRSPEGGSASALGAIFEEAVDNDMFGQSLSEDGSPGIKGSPRGNASSTGTPQQSNGLHEDLTPVSAHDQAIAAAVAADPEGRRIYELLVRFDAKQLRTECAVIDMRE